MQIAAALKAEKLILMTDVPGVLRDKDDISTKFTELGIRETRELVAEGVIAGGMIPKYVILDKLCMHASLPAAPRICGPDWSPQCHCSYSVQAVTAFIEASCCSQGGVLCAMPSAGRPCHAHH